MIISHSFPPPTKIILQLNSRWIVSWYLVMAIKSHRSCFYKVVVVLLLCTVHLLNRMIWIWIFLKNVYKKISYFCLYIWQNFWHTYILRFLAFEIWIYMHLIYFKIRGTLYFVFTLCHLIIHQLSYEFHLKKSDHFASAVKILI